MDSNLEGKLNKLINDPIEINELLAPGYKNQLEKIINQIIEKSKTRFNYQGVCKSFKDSGLEEPEEFADYFIRAIVIEFGISLDFESGFENCEERFREVNFPFKSNDLREISKQLIPLLRKELGAIRTMNYLIKQSTPLEVIIEKIKKDIEIKTNEFGEVV